MTLPAAVRRAPLVLILQAAALVGVSGAQAPAGAAADAEPIPRAGSNHRFYAGIGLGAARYSVSAAEVAMDIDAQLSVGTATVDALDDDAFAYKFYAGYYLHPRVAGEIGWANLGALDATIAITDETTMMVDSAEAARAVEEALPSGGAGPTLAIRALLTEPGTPIEVYARLGAFIWRGDVEASVSVDLNDESADFDQDGLSAFFGLGLGTRLSEELVVAAEWERYRVSNENVDLFWLNVRYSFGGSGAAAPASREPVRAD